MKLLRLNFFIVAFTNWGTVTAIGDSLVMPATQTPNSHTRKLFLSRRRVRCISTSSTAKLIVSCGYFKQYKHTPVVRATSKKNNPISNQYKAVPNNFISSNNSTPKPPCNDAISKQTHSQKFGIPTTDLSYSDAQERTTL